MLLIGLAAATFRLTMLLSDESGPFDVILRLRLLLSRIPFFHDLISCFYCLSVWMSALMCCWAAALSLITWGAWPIYWMASSGLAIVMHTFVEHQYPLAEEGEIYG